MTRTSTWAGLFLTLLGFVAGGLLAEIGVRIYAASNGEFGETIRQWDPMAVLIEPHGVYGYRQRPNSTYDYGSGVTAHSNTMGFRGPEVSPTKPLGTVRVVLLGGSTTHGWGVDDDQTIGWYLQALLPERIAGSRFEVVNLAFDGYDSYQILERLRGDGLPLDPDIIVVNTGVNDVRNARFRDLDLVDPDPRTIIWRTVLRRLRAEAERGGPSLWTRIKHYSYLARVPGLIRTNVARRRGHQRQSVIDKSLDPEFLGAAVDYFAVNIDRIVQLSRDHGAALVLSTPPSSLLSLYPPHRKSRLGYWIGNAETTQSYRDSLAGELVRIVAARQPTDPPIYYLSARLPDEQFLDDAHLTPAGNEAMAHEFAEVIAVILEGRPSLSRPSSASNAMIAVP